MKTLLKIYCRVALESKDIYDMPYTVGVTIFKILILVWTLGTRVLLEMLKVWGPISRPTQCGSENHPRTQETQQAMDSCSH